MWEVHRKRTETVKTLHRPDDCHDRKPIPEIMMLYETHTRKSPPRVAWLKHDVPLESVACWNIPKVNLSNFPIHHFGCVTEKRTTLEKHLCKPLQLLYHSTTNGDSRYPLKTSCCSFRAPQDFLAGVDCMGGNNNLKPQRLRMHVSTRTNHWTDVLNTNQDAFRIIFDR